MTLREYIDNLNELLEEYPDAANYTVITAKDAEGNGYDRVYYTPTLGKLDDDGDFIHLSSFEDYDLEKDDADSVCVN